MVEAAGQSVVARAHPINPDSSRAARGHWGSPDIKHLPEDRDRLRLHWDVCLQVGLA